MTRMLRSRIGLLCLVLLPSSLCAESSLAVLSFGTTGLDTRLAAIVTDAVRNEITDLGEYTVLRRDRMQEILKTHALLDTTCYERTCAVEMGKALSVDEVLIGTLTQRGDEVYLECSIIHVTTAQEVASADRVISHSTDITPFRKAGQNLARSLLGYPISERGWRWWAVRAAVAGAGIAYLVQQWLQEDVGDAEIIARFPGR